VKPRDNPLLRELVRGHACAWTKHALFRPKTENVAESLFSLCDYAYELGRADAESDEQRKAAKVQP
jgi:hypothetical protein